MIKKKLTIALPNKILDLSRCYGMLARYFQWVFEGN